MTNPYAGRPKHAFWRHAVAGVPCAAVDPMVEAPFVFDRRSRVATAGSCFAQHIARTLVALDCAYLVTEPAPRSSVADDENFGVFPARFGNVYTSRQLLQLFDRAFGLFEPVDRAWTRSDGRFVDPFRPRIQTSGFASPDDVEIDRRAHLAAVRDMFETADILIFTLGLTEGWEGPGGAVFPLAPGVVGDPPAHEGYRFRNFGMGEIVDDFRTFLAKLRVVNPAIKVILTVSPVPLIATYEAQHVLVATTYSKAVLRVAADEIVRSEPGVGYFPSYEIITGPQTRGAYYAEDLRDITPDGVAHVMRIFVKHYLAQGDAGRDVTPSATAEAARLHQPTGAPPKAAMPNSYDRGQHTRGLGAVVCDEEAIEVHIGGGGHVD